VPDHFGVLPMQQRHLPVSAEVRRLSVSPKAVDQKRAILVRRNQEIGPDLSEQDIGGLVALSTA
jgi:hypothetical protein